MIDKTLSLPEYRALLDDCRRALRANKRRRILRTIIAPIYYLSLLISALIVLEGIRRVISNVLWAAVPVCVGAGLFLFTRRISLADRDNAISRLLDPDYCKEEFRSLNRQRSVLEYCIQCRENGTEIDTATLLVCSE